MQSTSITRFGCSWKPLAGSRWTRLRPTCLTMTFCALFESCLLHFRALLEFFKTSRAEPDDLRAVDYIDDAKHKADFGNLAPNDAERARVKELHKALAHVVVGRDALNTDWSESDFRLVKNRLSLFFAWLPAPRLRWFPLAEKWFSDSFKR